MDRCLLGPTQIITKLHANWGHASAKQLGQAPVDPDGGNVHLANYVGEVLEQRELCRTFDRAPHAPINGLSGNLLLGGISVRS